MGPTSVATFAAATQLMNDMNDNDFNETTSKLNHTIPTDLETERSIQNCFQQLVGTSAMSSNPINCIILAYIIYSFEMKS